MIHIIKNSDNEDLCLQIYEPLVKTNRPKFAIVCHGITGYKEQDVILCATNTLINSGYRVITFDCRNSRGESYNNGQCATLTSMEEDLQTVINWAIKRYFYTEPFLLVGHSLGGAVVLDYAQKHVQAVSGLILLSTIFDGNEFLQNMKNYSSEFLYQLQNGGIIRTRNKINCFLDDTFLKNLVLYDLYKDAKSLTMPVLMITGDKDTSSTAENNKRFHKYLKCQNEFFVLSDCSHVYDKLQNQKKLGDRIQNFLLNFS